MDYQELKQSIEQYSQRDLEQRKHWYSPAAIAYQQARPSYPPALIDRVVEIAQLSQRSQILEIGCGPATATVAFAQLGCSMLCLEPNPDFYQLAQQNCQQYPQIEIQNTALEEWVLANEQFDVVLAATSFHWIPADIGYPKASQAMRSNGHLVLLWNKELQPSYNTFQQLAAVYQVHAPDFIYRYQDKDTQLQILQGLGQIAIDSGQFQNLVAGQVESVVMYSVDRYLMLLNTYSPYLKLEPAVKEALFNGLAEKIENDLGGSLQLSYISAFHIAQKC
jgi:protein-L-isoaspartate O-methyltransferase